MSALDVHEIICPIVERERDELRDHRTFAEAEIVELRRRLAEYVSGCPDPFDGNGWYEFLFAQEAA